MQMVGQRSSSRLGCFLVVHRALLHRFAGVSDELADHVDPHLALELDPRLGALGDGDVQKTVASGDALEAVRSDHGMDIG